MVEITNRSLGPRVIYAKGADGGPVPRTLARGETADITLHRSVKDDPVLAAWVEAQEIIIGPAPNEPGQPSREQLMAAWQERHEMGEAFARLHERVQDLETENRRLREAAAGSNQATGGSTQGSDATGSQGSAQQAAGATSGQGGGTGNDAPPNFETMSDDQLRTFLVARDVTPGNWQRARLLREAEAVKDVAPVPAA